MSSQKKDMHLFTDFSLDMFLSNNNESVSTGISQFKREINEKKMTFVPYILSINQITVTLLYWYAL